MKHFTISGRIPGDDEDTTLYVGQRDGAPAPPRAALAQTFGV